MVIKYYCEKYIWFLRICCNVNCLINITKSNGVLSYEFISYTLMNGSSNSCIFIFINCFIFSCEESMLLKNWLILGFNSITLALFYSHTCSVIEFNVGQSISYPSNFNSIIKTFFSWGKIVLFYTDSYTLSHWISYTRACINNDIFWKNGFLNWINL